MLSNKTNNYMFLIKIWNRMLLPREQKKLPMKLGAIHLLWKQKLVSQGQLVYVTDKLFTKISLPFSCFWIFCLKDGYWNSSVLSYVFLNKMLILTVEYDLICQGICHTSLSVAMHPVPWRKELVKQLKQTKYLFL